jgi:HAD superfamily hydrolase (TIGR01509 family)
MTSFKAQHPKVDLDWDSIDTVLLDMDGTLLDLHFDNFFWLEYLPKRYAEHHGICPDEATTKLHSFFNEKKGTLDWYCLEYWSEQLAMNIRQLKKEIAHLIQERPFVQEFLTALEKNNIQRVLITNAHHHSLELKLAITGIDQQLDQIITSHSYQAPKEDQLFWQKLHQDINFNPQRTLFIDDTESILMAAEKFGIKYLLCITQPDSKQAIRQLHQFPAITHFNELLPFCGSAE